MCFRIIYNGDSMNNRPILFVNSASSSFNGSENQYFFDSRRLQKSKVLHRIDDLLGFMYMGKRSIVSIIKNNCCYQGEVVKIDKCFIYLSAGYDVFKIRISEISDLKINCFM